MTYLANVGPKNSSQTRREPDTRRRTEYPGPDEVDTQVEEETRQSGGRKLRVETRQRRCGVCGEPGHNARTCAVDIEGTQEDDSE
jgi:hypothetical protein